MLAVEPEHDALFGASVQRIAIEREGRRDAANVFFPERFAVAQPEGVHPAFRLRFRRDVEPVCVEQRAGAGGAIEPRSPQHVAAGAIDEDDVAVRGAGRDDGLAECRSAADAAAELHVPQGPRVGVQGLLCGGVVAGGPEIGEPVRFLTDRTVSDDRRAPACDRVDTEKARH